MIENFNLTILTGGFSRCTPSWNCEFSEVNQCYKCYLPVYGKASLEMVDTSCVIAPGQFYFIPGYYLRRQQCEREMWVHWVHFVPESYYLRHCLSQIRSVHSWPLREVKWIKSAFTRIGELFEDVKSDNEHSRHNLPLALVGRVQSILMYLVADLLEIHGAANGISNDSQLRQLKPAIDFMDTHFQLQPSLAEVAAQAHMAPNYFHRLFRQVSDITPFEYMEQRRMDQARRLLSNSQARINEIAIKCGYENPLYFSRVFRRWFGFAPSDLRRRSSLLS